MKSKNTQISSGGYHVAWLIPLTGLFAFTMLTIGLKFWLGVAFLVFLLVLGYAIKKITDHKQKTSYNFESWSKAIKLAIRSNKEMSLLESYAVIDHK